MLLGSVQWLYHQQKQLIGDTVMSVPSCCYWWLCLINLFNQLLHLALHICTTCYNISLLASLKRTWRLASLRNRCLIRLCPFVISTHSSTDNLCVKTANVTHVIHLTYNISMTLHGAHFSFWWFRLHIFYAKTVEVASDRSRLLWRVTPSALNITNEIVI